MDILIFIILLIAGTCIPKVYKWVKYKIKYPILSADIPEGILEIGDIVCIGKLKCKYTGLKNNDEIGLCYVFKMEIVPLPLYIGVDATQGITAVYGRYGLKWKYKKQEK